MILVVDCNLRDVLIFAYTKKPGGLSVSSARIDIDETRDPGALERRVRALAGKEKIEAVSFRVIFGGDYFTGPTPVAGAFFARFRRLIDLFPFYAPTMLELLQRFRTAFRGIRLTAFFETSFFLRLPDEEKYYALPFEFHRERGIKKWGFHGIYHEANARIFSRDTRVISVVLDKQTTVSAIRDGRPLSISLGYTPLEGVMSRTSCGDLDPGIVLYLMNVCGYSLYRVDQMLKNESGFLGLTGYDVGMKELIRMRGRDAKVALAFDVYRAQLMKYIGEGIANMGGVDAIVFAGEYADTLVPVTHDLLKKISFLGINTVGLPWAKVAQGVSDISSDTSKIRVCINRTDLARTIFSRTARPA